MTARHFDDAQTVQAAKRWWINRFIQTPAGRSFALREHKLTEGAKIKSHVRQRNARFDIAFLTQSDFLVVSPRTNEATWCYGVIYPYKDSFAYLSKTWPQQLNLETADAAPA